MREHERKRESEKERENVRERKGEREYFPSFSVLLYDRRRGGRCCAAARVISAAADATADAAAATVTVTKPRSVRPDLLSSVLSKNSCFLSPLSLSLFLSF